MVKKCTQGDILCISRHYHVKEVRELPESYIRCVKYSLSVSIINSIAGKVVKEMLDADHAYPLDGFILAHTALGSHDNLDYYLDKGTLEENPATDIRRLTM